MAPLLAGLAVVLGAETTDLVPCYDGDCGVWSLLGDGLDREAPDADAACLCNATFMTHDGRPASPRGADAAGGPQPSPDIGPAGDAGRVPVPPPRA